MKQARFPFALLFLLAGTSCADDFAPYSRLDRLRVLAIQSEPAMPMPGTVASLSALTFAPNGEIPAMRWSWCPVQAKASESYACPLDEAGAVQVFAQALDATAAGVLPSFDLGTNASALFANPFSTDALFALCTYGIDSPLLSRSIDCDDGYPVTVVLDVATASDSLRAGFVLRLPVGSVPEINNNPAIAGLSLGEAPLGDPLTSVRLSADQAASLTIQVTAAVAEVRSIPPAEGGPGTRLERLTASWFASSGEIEHARTSFIDGTASLEEMSQNRFTAPAIEDWPADGVTDFAVVLRDDRGGSAWITRKVILERVP